MLDFDKGFVGEVTTDGPSFKNLVLIREEDFEHWLENEAEPLEKSWLHTHKFDGRAGRIAPVFNKFGGVYEYIAVVDNKASPYSYAHLPQMLPEDRYRLSGSAKAADAFNASVGWALGNYSFNHYKTATCDDSRARLLLPEIVDKEEIHRVSNASYLARDLINIPANGLGPVKMAEVAARLATIYSADLHIKVIKDEYDFPLIHNVGKAAQELPRLIDMRWGENENAPLVTLVGKGVTYDSGGLALKGREGMAYMKKDMGGAAHALALGTMIMDANLPIRLRILVPTVENAINERAYRNGDVIPSRMGPTVEVVNTDAEGRLILADALTFAGEDPEWKPDLLIDFATLTGAAKTVAGAGTPVMVYNDLAASHAIQKRSIDLDDRLQPIALDPKDGEKIVSAVADFANSSRVLPSHIFAAHFLQTFAPQSVPHIHIDHAGWQASPVPGRPVGGTDHGLRTMYKTIKQRYNHLIPAP